DSAGDLVLANEEQQVIDLDENRNHPGTSECINIKSSCYRNYTNLFDPIVIHHREDDEDLTHKKMKDLPPEEPVLVI
ncbi:hypothetical protein GOODEAATRI_024846, partial [Goodea atripinnis]